jgi:hypothetical protein
MKKYSFYLLLILLVISSCKDKEVVTPVENPTITSNFKLTFQGSPFSMNKRYSVNATTTIFTRLSFFISNVVLISPSGETKLADVSFLDLSTLDQNNSTAGINLNLGTAPAGTYTAIRLGIGLDNTHNAKRPSEYTVGNILAENAQYWDSWSSYIFSKMEGNLDADGDGTLETGITLHTGGSNVYKEFTLQKPITIKTGSSNNINFSLDLETLLTATDLKLTNNIHNAGDLKTMQKIVANIGNSIK